MCAKKATPPTTRKPTAAGKSAANGKAPAATAAKRPAAPAPRTLSPLDIGAVAGEIWSLLASGEAQSLAAIKKAVDAPSDVVLAAVGWLAREDKLTFTMSGRTLKIALKG
jgi:Winged helix-turn-helix domain (DUF2582)